MTYLVWNYFGISFNFDKSNDFYFQISDNSHGIGSIWGQRRLAGGGWIEEVRLQREMQAGWVDKWRFLAHYSGIFS